MLRHRATLHGEYAEHCSPAVIAAGGATFTDYVTTTNAESVGNICTPVAKISRQRYGHELVENRDSFVRCSSFHFRAYIFRASTTHQASLTSKRTAQAPESASERPLKQACRSFCNAAAAFVLNSATMLAFFAETKSYHCRNVCSCFKSKSLAGIGWHPLPLSAPLRDCTNKATTKSRRAFRQPISLICG